MTDFKIINGFLSNGSSGHSESIVTGKAIECPFCHVSIETQPLVYVKFDDKKIQIFLKCKLCKRSFIGSTVYDSTIGMYHIDKLSKGNHKVTEFTKEINELSPQFVKIFGEAESAEQETLMEICGVGYRKALEFLIKDYLIKNNPGEKDEIERKSLGNCIKENIDSSKIKKIAEKATWLGNDETHYVRKWEDKDLKDLKILISITVHYILMDIQANTYIADME